MFETMYAAPGVGWPRCRSASEASLCDGLLGRKGSAAARCLINPEVLRVEGIANGDEGCLSFPGIFTPVERSLRRSCARRM
jgi:peptide deformylase